VLKTASHIKDLTVHASDGEIGSIEEFYFDDERWAIRYMIVNTGSWLSQEQVLISPIFLRRADWANKQLIVALTKEQIRNSPKIDTHKPVSRQHESAYMDYYGASWYWGGPYVWGPGSFPEDLAVPVPSRPLAAERESADSHLRSTAAVTGYGIEASDGEIGHVGDFVIDQETWKIRYLEVKTRNWWPGKMVLVSPEWVEKVSWPESRVSVGLSREAIKSAPEYIESRPITRDYEERLHLHYGRAPYWLQATGPAQVRRAGATHTV
jgi:sporulation protein YlmC with PRC-barrel domain